MPDFFQSGAIATLHRLGDLDTRRIERELREFTREKPIALVLPCHIRELGTPALQTIVSQLRHVRYLAQIVVGIDGANATQWRKARAFFSQLPQRPVLLWNDGLRMQRLLARLTHAGMPAGPRGKGRNVWLCCGQVLAAAHARMIAVHDCDIINYDRELLARLCYPVAHPAFGFDFCKGYYARASDQLNGRVMRLLVTPVLRALRNLLGPQPFLAFLDGFRYPLAGEISLDTELARRNRMPFDWGLEVGMLGEVFRNSAPRSICQAELCANYDHKHQSLSPRNPAKGLHRMAIDIMRAIFRRLAGDGIKLDHGLFETLQVAYTRHAADAMRAYAADATMNGLAYHHSQEETAVATFARGIAQAAAAHLGNPLFSPLIPDWNQVESALPGFLADLRRTVAEDSGTEALDTPRRT